MPADRDDDPVHPNFDGIRFQATTDRKGVICTPTSADRAPPVTYMPAEAAARFSAELRELVADLQDEDPGNYAAAYFESVAEDLDAALAVCTRGNR